MTTALTTPTHQPAQKGTRAIAITLILAVIAAVVAGVVGGLLVLRASAEAESARQAEAFAEVLPDTFNLAVNLSFERDAVVAGVPPVVLRPLRQTTDEAAQAWRTRAQEIDSDDDKELDATLTRMTQELSNIDVLRTQAQNDPAIGSKHYTALTNDLFSIADDLPNTGEDQSEQAIEAIGHMPEAWESLGQERAIMFAALSYSPLPGAKPISDEEIAALTEAEAAWRRSLAAFYEKSSEDQRAALDGLTNSTATKGATGVPAHQAVNDIIAGGGSAVTLDSYTASSTEFMRGLQEIFVASAQEIVEGQRAARDDAVRGALAGLVLTFAVVGVLALLIVVLAVVLVILRRSASARGARG
ncbi:nitrate- and nitrite sensing domain-containing protein [Nocardioides sp. NPDC051685]|uniref:nitrate- and nitrite sensing domain-containing protein n=1 Tax=Nocardioides sp. NPDC051685 TaxID=3364334 RepID=UPI0037942447